MTLHDSYISVVEALKHGGIPHGLGVQLLWIDAEELEQENVADRLAGADGLIVPGGFGDRGSSGMIAAIQYARTHRMPFLGICLGMQLAVVEFARNVLGWADANSTEFDSATEHPVIHFLPDQTGEGVIGGTLRRGAYPCVLKPGTKAVEVYGQDNISERHRHRYEVNNQFRAALAAGGLVLSGTSPDGNIVEMIEIQGHPYFVGTQAHPEFKSRPNRPHPLFAGLVGSSFHK
jgi:CTP synthase